MVNAGDHTVSMLRRNPDDSLSLQSHVPSGGLTPVSVTESSGVVYVLNAGFLYSDGGVAAGNRLPRRRRGPRPDHATAAGAQ